MYRRHSPPGSRSELTAGLAGLNGPAACIPMAMAAGGPLPKLVARPHVRQASLCVLEPLGPASGTLPCWIRRFLNPNDLVGLKGLLLLAIFLAGGLIGGA